MLNSDTLKMRRIRHNGIIDRWLHSPRNFIRLLYARRAALKTMVLREMRLRYAGTFAGMVWSVFNPLSMILVYWFVFSVGLKVQPVGGAPFIIVFMCGFVPWIFMVETIDSAMNSIVANPHLVKKAVFPTEILPIVHLLTSLITQIVMTAFLCLILIANGMSLSIYNLQFIYYLFGLSVFVLGQAWLFSALNVFVRDVGQFVRVLLNIWFWLTPIVWPPTMIPERYRSLLKINPVYYIVEGYQKSFVSHEFFGNSPLDAIVFWVVALTTFLVGALVFKRMKPEFADAL